MKKEVIGHNCKTVLSIFGLLFSQLRILCKTTHSFILLLINAVCISDPVLCNPFFANMTAGILKRYKAMETKQYSV
jgi:hypothetical protein